MGRLLGYRPCTCLGRCAGRPPPRKSAAVDGQHAASRRGRWRRTVLDAATPAAGTSQLGGPATAVLRRPGAKSLTGRGVGLIVPAAPVHPGYLLARPCVIGRPVPDGEAARHHDHCHAARAAMIQKRRPRMAAMAFTQQATGPPGTTPPTSTARGLNSLRSGRSGRGWSVPVVSRPASGLVVVLLPTASAATPGWSWRTSSRPPWAGSSAHTGRRRPQDRIRKGEPRHCVDVHRALTLAV
jgi:hypothetical protein